MEKRLLIYRLAKLCLLLSFAFPAFAQTITVRGTVVDTFNEPVIGATISI